MHKSLLWKIVLIALLVFAALWALIPPSKTLKPGIDLAGGTSLIYEISTQDLKANEKRDLSINMIWVLRRRIDPANIQNLLWRPLGNTRFEIQMPLASAEARQKRLEYEKVRDELLASNVSRRMVLQTLESSPEVRKTRFESFAAGDPNKLKILDTLAEVYDERKELHAKRDAYDSELASAEEKIKAAEINLDLVKLSRSGWAKLDPNGLRTAVKGITDANDNIDLLNAYVKTYGDWAQVLNKLNDPNGTNARYADARNKIDTFNLSQEQLDRSFGEKKEPKRAAAVKSLIEEFPDRKAKIEKALAAYDEYRPYRGRLDDPKDLQRMLKGAGVLEFRVLPTQGNAQSDPDLMQKYVDDLKKGPKYASDDKYVWCEIESDREQWNVADAQGGRSIVGTFGDKQYVLTSNKKDEVMLSVKASPSAEAADQKPWKLERASQGQDQMGRRAISFTLDTRGGNRFSKLTGVNKNRPLCILLDGIAISAPNIQAQIRRHGIITGSFTDEQQKDMIQKLNAGSLPARLIEQPISINTIGPSIGAENRDQGINAGLIGLVVVMACMLTYYMLSGSIADIALLMNILFVLATMAFIGATFTLPGIAGIILTIGMSVDANVLIFERIREEQQKGSSLRIAITNGYQRAFRTIFDANVTTFITAAILYWVASEEIKGFAIVLMLGIISSMFTALFVTRVVFDLLLSRRLIKDRLFMLRLIHNPNVNWMKLRPVFFTISIVLIAAGAFVFFTRGVDKYDIEFTGGTSAQTNFKSTVKYTRQDVEDKIRPALASANVYSVGKPIGKTTTGENIYKQYRIDTSETNKIIVALAFSDNTARTAFDIEAAIREAQNQAQFSADLSNLAVAQDANDSSNFIVTTSQMNQALVKKVLKTAFAAADISEPVVDETVNNAILGTFRGELEVQENLRPKITAEEKISQTMIDSSPELAEFIDGLKITCELGTPTTQEDLRQRISTLQFKPDTRNLKTYDYKILDQDLNLIIDPNTVLKSFVFVSADPEAGLRDLSDEEWTIFVENEKTKVLSAGQLATTLPRVRQFDPSVGAEAKTRALIAIVLSLSAIVTYIWVRFGNVRYGIAAIVALVHDVSITLGAVAVCTYIAASPIGEKLLIGDFKINLAMIAAFLTLIGYSLNDTIVIFDRIRENRGKAKLLNAQIITNSINQTISRTIMTSFTTFVVVLIMYIFGGPSLRGFTFAIGLGIIVGTYSSIAIAAPILLLGTKLQTNKKGKAK